MDVQKRGSQIRDFAIGVMIVILIPYFIRYGVRAFIGPVDFPVWPLIGIGFLVLSDYTKNIFLSLLLLCYGAKQLLFIGFFGWYGFEEGALSQWLILLISVAALLFLGYVLYKHDRYEYDTIVKN